MLAPSTKFQATIQHNSAQKAFDGFTLNDRRGDLTQKSSDFGVRCITSEFSKDFGSLALAQSCSDAPLLLKQNSQPQNQVAGGALFDSGKKLMKEVPSFSNFNFSVSNPFFDHLQPDPNSSPQFAKESDRLFTQRVASHNSAPMPELACGHKVEINHCPCCPHFKLQGSPMPHAGESGEIVESSVVPKLKINPFNVDGKSRLSLASNPTP